MILPHLILKLLSLGGLQGPSARSGKYFFSQTIFLLVTSPFFTMEVSTVLGGRSVEV